MTKRLAANLVRLLGEAEQRVANDQIRLGRLHVLVSTLREGGRDTLEAERLLLEFQQALADDIASRDRLASRLAALVA
jgi:hypothetical protein